MTRNIGKINHVKMFISKHVVVVVVVVPNLFPQGTPHGALTPTLGTPVLTSLSVCFLMHALQPALALPLSATSSVSVAYNLQSKVIMRTLLRIFCSC